MLYYTNCNSLKKCFCLDIYIPLFFPMRTQRGLQNHFLLLHIIFTTTVLWGRLGWHGVIGPRFPCKFPRTTEWVFETWSPRSSTLATMPYWPLSIQTSVSRVINASSYCIQCNVTRKLKVLIAYKSCFSCCTDMIYEQLYSHSHAEKSTRAKLKQTCIMFLHRKYVLELSQDNIQISFLKRAHQFADDQQD